MTAIRTRVCSLGRKPPSQAALIRKQDEQARTGPGRTDKGAERHEDIAWNAHEAQPYRRKVGRGILPEYLGWRGEVIGVGVARCPVPYASGTPERP